MPHDARRAEAVRPRPVSDDDATIQRVTTVRSAAGPEVVLRLAGADRVEYVDGCKRHAAELRERAARWREVDEYAERYRTEPWPARAS